MNTNRRKNVRINAVLWLKIPVYIFGNDNPQRSSNKKKGGVGVNKNVFFANENMQEENSDSSFSLLLLLVK
jgi:hypothetical protein